MMKLNLQFFAHKKGVGSTKNGRDSESKKIGFKSSGLESFLNSTIYHYKILI